MENWKDIVGFEGRYKISDKGRVLSLKGNRKILTNIKSGENQNGYIKVSLSNNGIISQKNIHRLLAEHFIDNPFNKPQVNHIDGNKQNNKLDNLEWVTAQENSTHSYSMGLSKGISRYGEDNHRSKRVKQIFSDGSFKVWDSMMSAKRAGYDIGCICRCCKGENSTHKNSKWEYTDLKPTEKTFSDKIEIDVNLEKKCNSCGSAYSTKKINSLYCSRKCAKRIYNKRYKEKIKIK